MIPKFEGKKGNYKEYLIVSYEHRLVRRSETLREVQQECDSSIAFLVEVKA